MAHTSGGRCGVRPLEDLGDRNRRENQSDKEGEFVEYGRKMQ
jgi:hypothetical protein